MTPDEDVYFFFEYIIADGAAHAIRANGWRVQKVQFFAASGAPGVVRLFNPTGTSSGAVGVGNVLAGGCLTLEPERRYREAVEVSGNGSRVYIEYTFEPSADQLILTPTVTPP